MKIYESITIDIKTSEIISEYSYNYEGSLAIAKGGGGGGGSGEVDYPVYMKEVQADWLAGGEADGSGLTTLSVGNDMTSLLDSAVSSNPFDSATAYDPSTEISDMSTAIQNYCSSVVPLPDLDAATRFQEAVDALNAYDNSTPFTDTEIELDNYKNYIDSLETTSQIESELAKFNKGAQNINAVNSSSFSIGHQIIASNLVEVKLQSKSDLVKKHSELAQLKNQKAVTVAQGAAGLADSALKNDQANAQLVMDKRGKVAHYNLEYLRLSITANVEQTNKDIKLNKQQAQWPITIFEHGGNVLAGIGGGTVSDSAQDEMSDGQAAASGAISGAAAGAMIGAEYGTTYGGYWGAAIGAVVGGIGGALSN